jgi:regulator of cell morphogenesis and NO signaling
MTIDSNRTVGELAVENPNITRVFARHDIDYCCGGAKPLRDACASRNLDADSIIEEIEKELAGANPPTRRWDEASIDELIDHILLTYHRPLDEELPRLEAMADKVLSVHRDKAEKMLTDLVATYKSLKAELVAHMFKEEQILFPMLRHGQGAMAGGPISVMINEHDGAGAALARMRALTDGYTVPAEACNTWRALWHGLASLEQALHEHIHLENNILFPRALKPGA